MQIASTWNHANKGCNSLAGCKYLAARATAEGFAKGKHDNLQQKEDNGSARDPRCPIFSTIRSAFVRDRGSGSEENGGLADGAARIAFCWSSNSWPGGTTDGRRDEMQSQACSSGTDQRLLWMDALTVISGSV